MAEGSMGAVALRTRLDLTGLRSGLKAAETETTKTVKGMSDRMASLGTSMQSAGRKMTLGITAPLVAAGTGIVALSSGFEKSMNRVRALSGATGQDFEKLRDQARKLGADTQFSASEAADAMSFLAMAGFETNQIYASMPDTLNLAAAAQLDMGSAADIVSNIMTGFGLRTDQLGNAVDVLSKAFISSNTDLSQLGEGMKFVGPISSGLGVSFEETTAALGQLSNAGIQGGMAGTSLRRILGTLASEADKLGIATTDSAGKMRPLADIIDDLNAKGLTTTDTLEIFGDRGGPAMSALLSQGGQSLRDFTRELEDAGGTAQMVAETQMAGLHGQIKELQSAGEELALSLGDAGLLGAAKGLVTGLTGLVRRFNELPQPAKTATLVIGGITAAIGPLLIGVGTLLVNIPKLAAGFALLKTAGLAALGPAGWIALGVTGIVALGAALHGQQKDSLTNAVKAASDAFASGDKDSFVSALDAVAKKADGDTRASLERLREELIQTGDVAVEQSQRAVLALAQIDLANKGGFGGFLGIIPQAPGGLRTAATRASQLTGVDHLDALSRAIDSGEYGQVMNALNGILLAFKDLQPIYKSEIESVQQYRDRLRDAQETAGAFSAPPAGSTPAASQSGTTAGGFAGVDGPAGTPSDPVTVDVVEKPGRPLSPATLRAMGLAEAAGPGAGMSTGMSQAETTAALRANRDAREAEARAAREAAAEIAVRTAQQRREIETIAGVNAARHQLGEALAGVAGGVEAFAGDLRVARDAVIDARFGDSADELARFSRNAVSLTATLKNAADQAEFAAGLSVFSDRQRGVFGRGTTNAVRPSQADAEIANARVAVREAVQAFHDGKGGIQAVEEAVDALATLTPMTVAAIDELTGSVVALAREAAAVAAFDENPDGRLHLFTPIPKTLTPEQIAFNNRMGASQHTRREDNPADLAEAARINREREAQRIADQKAADDFANTVVTAGFSFGNAAIQAFQDGDVAGVIQAGLSGAGSILGSADLGSLSFLGGSIGIGSLIAGGLGLIGTLLGGLIGGGNREAEERRRREQQQARSVPAITIAFNVQQTNHYQGGPRDVANEQAFSRQADSLFESFYTRVLDPRLSRLERAAGIVGV